MADFDDIKTGNALILWKPEWGPFDERIRAVRVRRTPKSVWYMGVRYDLDGVPQHGTKDHRLRLPQKGEVARLLKRASTKAKTIREGRERHERESEEAWEWLIDKIIGIVKEGRPASDRRRLREILGELVTGTEPWQMRREQEGG